MRHRGRAVGRVVFTLIGAIGVVPGQATGLPSMPALSTLVGLTCWRAVAPDTDHARRRLLPRGRDLAVRSRPGQLGRARHHQRHGPGRRRLPPVRSCHYRGCSSMDEQRPNNVKDLLVELKDASELMVDLAYAAVFFNEEKLAERGRAARRADGRATCGGCGRWRCSRRAAPRTPRAWRACCGSPRRSRRSATPPSDIARVVAARLGHPRRAAARPPPRRRDHRPREGPRGRAR